MSFVPNPMTHTSARLLEFETLRQLLAGYSSSAPGRRRIAELSPSLDSEWIARQHQLTAEIREFRRVGGRFEFTGLPEVARLLDKSRIVGAAFETTEIRDIVLLVDRASEWREIVKQPPAAMRSEWTAVATLSEGIEDFAEFLRSFRNKILPDGSLDDRASPELSRIRREIEGGRGCAVCRRTGGAASRRHGHERRVEYRSLLQADRFHQHPVRRSHLSSPAIRAGKLICRVPKSASCRCPNQ